jgi:hypothetical protein
MVGFKVCFGHAGGCDSVPSNILMNAVQVTRQDCWRSGPDPSKTSIGWPMVGRVQRPIEQGHMWRLRVQSVAKPLKQDDDLSHFTK